MGFYEYVYACGCVNCTSSLDNFESPPYYILTCDAHTLKNGNKFKYNLSKFIQKYWKKNHLTNTYVDFSHKFIYDVEVLDFVKHISNNFNIVKFKTNLDISCLDETKQIFFSEFDDQPSWIKTDNIDNTTIITLIFESNAIERVIEPHNLIYDWKKNCVREKDM